MIDKPTRRPLRKPPIKVASSSPGEKSPGEPEGIPAPSPTGKAKGWEGLSEEGKLKTALHHFGIKRADVLSYRVYPHKVAIVYGFGQKVEYWPPE